MSSSNYRVNVRDNTMDLRQKLTRSFWITKDQFVMRQTPTLRNFPIILLCQKLISLAIAPMTAGAPRQMV